MKRTYILLAVLLAATTLWALGPIPGTDNYMYINMVNGTPTIHVASADFHMTGPLSLDSQILAADGSLDAPSYAFTNAPSAGVYLGAANSVALKGQDGIGTNVVGQRAALKGGRGTGSAGGGNISLQLTVPGASGSSLNSHQNAFFAGGSNGLITVGGLNLLSGIQTVSLSGNNAAAGTTDIAAANLFIEGGRGTGTGANGTVRINLAPAATGTGTTQNALRVVELWNVSSLADPQTTEITMTGGNSGTMVRKSFSELLTLSTGGTTTDTSANLLPAGSIILSVTTRVTTTISGGGVAAFSVGDPTTVARFSASAGGLTAGSTRIGLQHQQGSVTTDAAGPVQTSAAKVRITADATPTAGVVRIQVWALVFTAPTS